MTHSSNYFMTSDVPVSEFNQSFGLLDDEMDEQ